LLTNISPTTTSRLLAGYLLLINPLHSQASNLNFIFTVHPDKAGYIKSQRQTTMTANKHNAEAHRRNRTLPSIRDQAFLLMTIAFTAPLFKTRKPKTIYKYFVLSSLTSKPLNHENY
jgi:hypothetical protein